jgi:hypothetical protein
MAKSIKKAAKKDIKAAVSNPSEHFIDERETSAQLKIAVQTLRGWRQQRRGPPFFRFGRRIRYSPEENVRWARAQCESTGESAA